MKVWEATKRGRGMRKHATVKHSRDTSYTVNTGDSQRNVKGGGK